VGDGERQCIAVVSHHQHVMYGDHRIRLARNRKHLIKFAKLAYALQPRGSRSL
jgi:hypothetical protein